MWGPNLPTDSDFPRVMAFSIMKWWHHFHVLTIKTFAGSMVSIKVIPLQYIYTIFHVFFIHLLPLWSFREKFYHLLPAWIREKVWRCPITGDYFTALPDSEVPWVICQCSFANILVIWCDFAWPCCCIFMTLFWGGIQSTKHLAAARQGHGCAKVASTELSEESSGALES